MKTTRFIALIGLLFLSACADTKPQRNDARVTVDIAPMRGVMSEILNDGIEIHTLVLDAATPHGFSLRPSDVLAIRSSGLIVNVGAGLSPMIHRAVEQHGSGAQVVFMSDLLGIEYDPHAHHSHAPGEPCDHGDTDPHLWLDPSLVRAFYESIPESLIGDWIDAAKLEAAIARVEGLERRIETEFSSLNGTTIVTQHHAFSRLCERLGISVVDTVRDGMHLDPSPASVAALSEQLRGGDVDMVFVEPQFPSALSERLAASADVRVGVLDPLGNGDWFDLMDNILAALESIDPELTQSNQSMDPSGQVP